MTTDAFISGTGEHRTSQKIREMVENSGSGRLFFASAYASWRGVTIINKILSETGIEDCSAIFGLDGCVTDPAAIERSRELGWNLRLVEQSGHSFHPKMALVGGGRSIPHIEGAVTGYIGSSNFTQGGLETNVEAGLITREEDIVSQLREMARQLWAMSTPPEEVDLDRYATRYAEIERTRPSEQTQPGKAESSTSGNEPEDTAPPETPSYHHRYATAVWVGLESFTGDYTLQIEFPRTPAEVVRNLIGEEGGDVLVQCSDGIREMDFHFYEDNQMDRLNVPNDVPGVERARREETGIALIEKADDSVAPVSLSILFDDPPRGRTASEIVERSKRIGSWGETSTRLYGWF